MSNLKKNKKKLTWTRILCLILAFLMVAGMGALGLTLLINEISATDAYFEESEYAFSNKTDGDTYIAVGLMYGSNITVGFEIKAPYGFVVGTTVITEDERSFVPFHYLDTTIASTTVDANLSKKSMTYYLTDSPSATVIGGYHLELTNLSYDRFPFEHLVQDVNSQISGSSVYAIPAYIGGKHVIRLGDYATYSAAEEALSVYANTFPEYSVAIASPSKTAVSVVNPENDKILFEYDNGENGGTLGFTAYQADEFASYIQTPADNLYEGVMTFIPKYTDTYTGVALTNLLDLESYVEGVLPYEISNSWSREVLRTFAITIRSYALANYCKRYNSYGFDMTATQSDQVYKGRNRVNDSVVEAVSSTKGLVMTYDDKIISAYYSSSVGGSTIGSQYVWGSARGYLTSVATPWEKYSEYNNGLWYTEVSPEALLSTLRSRGYTELSGAIASVEVETVSDNPEYVYAIKFTDTKGTSVKVTRSDTVRTTLSSYVKSANFTVGKGYIDRTYDKVYEVEVVGGGGVVIDPPKTESFSITGFVTSDQLLISEAYVVTETEEIMASEYPVAYVLTSTGRKVLMNSCVATANNYDDTIPFEYDKNSVTLLDPSLYEETPDEFFEETDEFSEGETYQAEVAESTYYNARATYGSGVRKVMSEFKNVTVITTLETVTERLNASSEGNFIFAGKGWGHGVGISQYGARDLSDAGASAEQILSIYFTNIDIVHKDNIPQTNE